MKKLRDYYKNFNLCLKAILCKVPIIAEDNSFVPQGVCSIDGKIVVSCYDSLKENNSILYVFSSKNVFKKIVLDCKVHVGGICYHVDSDSLFVTGHGSKDKSYIYKYSGKEVLNLENNQQITKINSYCVDYDNSLYSSAAKRTSPSYITCFKNYLFVGNFCVEKDKERSIIRKFRILSDGSISKNSEIIRNPYFNTQGLCLMENNNNVYYVFSRSFGRKKNSIINICKLVNNKFIEISSLVLPSMLEQVNNYNEDIIVVFESSAYIYRNNSITINDEVFLLDFSKILKIKDQDNFKLFSWIKSILLRIK